MKIKDAGYQYDKSASFYFCNNLINLLVKFIPTS